MRFTVWNKMSKKNLLNLAVSATCPACKLEHPPIRTCVEAMRLDRLQQQTD